MLQIGVLASGRGSNLEAIINRIEDGSLEVNLNIVLSDREGALALERARRNGIKNKFINPAHYQSKRDFEEALIWELEKQGVELVVMAGFMRILSPYFIKHYQQRIMNIHPSLLPAFPGLHAPRQALKAGVKISGCTVHFADEGMDTGAIILQAAVPVKDDDTEETLAQRILEQEHIIYPQAIKLYSQGKLELKDGRVKIKR